jgi:hypothetical protein
MAYFIPSDLAMIIILASFGYILASIDLLYVISCSIKLNKFKSVSPSVVSLDQSNKFQKTNQISYMNKFPFNFKDWFYHLVLYSLTIFIVIIVYLVFTANNFTINFAFQIETYFLYAGIGLFFIVKIFSDLQGVYFFFGLFRNPFYAEQCLSCSLKKEQKFSINSNKLFFKFLKYIRLILIRISKLF